MEQHRQHVEQDRIKAAEARTKELVLESAQIRSLAKGEDTDDHDDDDELQCMVDAFEELEVVEDSESSSSASASSQERES